MTRKHSKTLGQQGDEINDETSIATPDATPYDSLMDELQGLSKISTEELIVCANCRTAVTHQTHKINILQSHQHRFTNPAGIVYSIRCFCEALGCSIQGEPTQSATWFSGFAWQLAYCENCGEHLGWYYQGIAAETADDHFYGLISNRLKDSVD